MPSNSSTQYNNTLGGFAGWSATESLLGTCMGSDQSVIFSSFRIDINTAPTGSASWTFNIRVNGITVSTITITGSATSGTSSTAFIVNPSDQITLQSVPSGSPVALTWMRIIHKIRGDQSYWFTAVSSGTDIVAGNNKFLAPQFGGVQGQVNEYIRMPTSGTLSNLYLNTDVSQTGSGVTATLQVNPYVAGAYTGYVNQSLSCTVTAGNTKANDTNLAHAYHVNEGDLVGWNVVGNSGCPASRMFIGCMFTPDIPGEFVVLGGTQLAQNLSQYVMNQLNPNATEANIQCLAYACTVQKLANLVRISTGASIASGQTGTYTARKNGANAGSPSNLSSLVTGTAIANDDLTDSFTCVDGDLLSFSVATSATITSGPAYFSPGWVYYIPREDAFMGAF